MVDAKHRRSAAPYSQRPAHPLVGVEKQPGMVDCVNVAPGQSGQSSFFPFPIITATTVFANGRNWETEQLNRNSLSENPFLRQED